MARRFLFISCLILLTALLPQPRLAAQSSSSSSSKHPKPTVPSDSPLEKGTINAGEYRNTAFGFKCKIPPEWVLRTEEMNARDDETAKGDPSHPDKDTGAARVLLAAFSRPPEARGEDINASIVIAAESAATYPGLKDAAQYFGPVTEVATAQGLELDDDPYEFVLGTKKLVRGDFEKDVGSRVMRQSTLVMLARGYVVSFTFIGGTEDEVEGLVQGLSFGAPKPAH